MAQQSEDFLLRQDGHQYFEIIRDQTRASPSQSVVQVVVTVGQNQPQAAHQQQQQQQPPPPQQQSGQSVQVSSSAGTVTVPAQVAVVAHSPSPQTQQQQQQQRQQQASVVQTASAAGTPQFIAVAVSEQDSQGQAAVTLQPAQAVHPAYVHYVEGGASDPTLYAAANGQMTGYPVYSVTDSSTMYTPASGAYYNTGSGTAVTYSQDTSKGGGPLIPKLDPCSELSEIEVQWLIDNYETAEGVSLPRSTLYNHYLRHCAEHKLEPVNAASFGKLIRSVFLGLRTRRLGTRGNSKYHYYGIRVKPNSPLNQISDETGTTPMRQQPLNPNKRFKSNTPTKLENHEGSHSSVSSSAASVSEGGSATQHPAPNPQQQQHQQYLGDASAAIPNFIDIDFATSLPDGIRDADLNTFKDLYRDHCGAILDAVVNLQFSMVETFWQTFWRTHENNHAHSDHEKLLSKSKLYLLCKCEPVQRFVQKADYQFYQNLVDVLIPDVLRPIPSSLTQAIRNFAKSLEGWMTTAMTGCPEDILRIKMGAVSAFSQTLRRYTSLNHLAQAARAVLQNSSQINQMLADLNRVDFHNVQEQASWVCQCDEDMVQRLEQDFKLTLQQQNSLEQWAAWLESVVSLVLQPHEGKPDFPKAARQFLLKWSFYSSMVIRDLTLRSAASFGSFHLIRLLYDEYMFYLIEHRVAKATGETPIAVMGEFIGLGAKLDVVGRSAPAVGDLKSGGTVMMISSTNNNNNIIGNRNEGIAHGASYNSPNCTTTTAMTNGIKDASKFTVSSIHEGLIGQPAVNLAEVSTSSAADNILHSTKKLKAV